MPKYDLTNFIGSKFGRWTVLGKGQRSPARVQLWHVKCECGIERQLPKHVLTSGDSQSCGCLRQEMHSNWNITHGAKRGGHSTPEYSSWLSMKARCTNVYDPEFHNYGGRGISICENWLASFKAFLSDMGPRPNDSTLDRIDVNGNYEPGNCRWATITTQTRNMRSNRRMEFNGETLCLSEWAERYGLRSDCISARLKRGWSIAKALETPLMWGHHK